MPQMRQQTEGRTDSGQTDHGQTDRQTAHPQLKLQIWPDTNTDRGGPKKVVKVKCTDQASPNLHKPSRPLVESSPSILYI